jgi:hypothetical protein
MKELVNGFEVTLVLFDGVTGEEVHNYGSTTWNADKKAAVPAEGNEGKIALLLIERGDRPWANVYRSEGGKWVRYKGELTGYCRYIERVWNG